MEGITIDWILLLRFFIEVLTATALAIAVLWRLQKFYVDKKVEQVEAKLSHSISEIGERLRSNNEKVHESLGKIEVLATQIQSHEMARVKEFSELRLVFQQGLHDLRIELEKLRTSR